jgi:hypothetical protein
MRWYLARKELGSANRPFQTNAVFTLWDKAFSHFAVFLKNA